LRSQQTVGGFATAWDICTRDCAAAAAAAAAASAGLLLLSNLLAQSGDVTCNSGIHERSSSMKKIPTTLPFTVFFI
jgi:hypothetical protein